MSVLITLPEIQHTDFTREKFSLRPEQGLSREVSANVELQNEAVHLGYSGSVSATVQPCPKLPQSVAGSHTKRLTCILTSKSRLSG